MLTFFFHTHNVDIFLKTVKWLVTDRLTTKSFKYFYSYLLSPVCNLGGLCSQPYMRGPQSLDTCLEFLELLIEGRQVVCLLQLGGLLLQVRELVVQVRVALHCRLRLVVLKELTGFGLGRNFQVGPALSDLLQLLLNDGTELRLLLDELLTLLETGNSADSQGSASEQTQSKALQSACCSVFE